MQGVLAVSLGVAVTLDDVAVYTNWEFPCLYYIMNYGHRAHWIHMATTKGRSIVTLDVQEAHDQFILQTLLKCRHLLCKRSRIMPQHSSLAPLKAQLPTLQHDYTLAQAPRRPRRHKVRHVR